MVGPYQSVPPPPGGYWEPGRSHDPQYPPGGGWGYPADGRWDAQANPYALPVRYLPRRRSVSGSVVGALGTVATIVVIGVLALSAFGSGDGDIGGTPGAGAQGRASRAAATGNPLYETGALNPVACRLPRIVAGSNVSLKSFMDTLSGCLDRV